MLRRLRGGGLDRGMPAMAVPATAGRSRHRHGAESTSLTERRSLLFGVSRDLRGAHDINEPRHRNEVDHCRNGYCQQPGARYLPAWIPSAHHSPLSVARGSEPVGAMVGEKQGAHRALVTMPQADALATKS
jgi:hypothetical protein